MTPIEELIEKLKINPILNANVLHIIESLDLIKKEHDEIVKAFRNGWANGVNFKADAENYFDKTYKIK